MHGYNSTNSVRRKQRQGFAIPVNKLLHKTFVLIEANQTNLMTMTITLDLGDKGINLIA